MIFEYLSLNPWYSVHIASYYFETKCKKPAVINTGNQSDFAIITNLLFPMVELIPGLSRASINRIPVCWIAIVPDNIASDERSLDEDSNNITERSSKRWILFKLSELSVLSVSLQ